MKSATPLNQPAKTLNIRGALIDLRTPVIMGILNVTPDSFYSGSRLKTETEILQQAEKMLTDGATFLDIGGYSSRPGAEDISTAEERSRTISAVQIVIKKFPQSILSIDTFRSAIAREAVLEGASIINDISAGELDTKMFETVAELKVPYIAMHMRGTPQTMKTLTEYDHLLSDIATYFSQKLSALKDLGVTDVIIDPGFGFAKTLEQNFQLLTHLDYFKILERPLLAGLSRKSMVWKTLNTTAEQALNGTTALNMVALLKGASILRVHDVKEAKETISLYSSLQR